MTVGFVDFMNALKGLLAFALGDEKLRAVVWEHEDEPENDYTVG